MTRANPHDPPRQDSLPPASDPADPEVIVALEDALTDSSHTRRAYIAQWRAFDKWCAARGLASVPAEPRTVVRYLEARAANAKTIAPLRQAASVITKGHEVAGYLSPCRDRSVRDFLKQTALRLDRPPRQARTLDHLDCYWIARYAEYGREDGRGRETETRTARRGGVDAALLHVMFYGGLRAGEASALTWGDVQNWPDGSGRIAVPVSPGDVARGRAVVAIPNEAMSYLDAIRPPAVASDTRDAKVFGLSASQIVRRLRAAAEAAYILDCEAISGNSLRAGLLEHLDGSGAPDHVIQQQGRRRQRDGTVEHYACGEDAGAALRYL